MANKHAVASKHIACNHISSKEVESAFVKTRLRPDRNQRGREEINKKAFYKEGLAEVSILINC